FRPGLSPVLAVRGCPPVDGPLVKPCTSGGERPQTQSHEGLLCNTYFTPAAFGCQSTSATRKPAKMRHGQRVAENSRAFMRSVFRLAFFLAGFHSGGDGVVGLGLDAHADASHFVSRRFHRIRRN